MTGLDVLEHPFPFGANGVRRWLGQVVFTPAADWHHCKQVLAHEHSRAVGDVRPALLRGEKRRVSEDARADISGELHELEFARGIGTLKTREVGVQKV